MKNFFKYLRNIFLILGSLYVTSIFVDIRIEGVELRSIYERAFNETYKAIDSFIDYVKAEPEVTEFTITKQDEGNYLFDITIKNVDEDEIVSVEIDGIPYETYVVTQENMSIHVALEFDVTFEAGLANKQFEITGITYLKNGTEKILDTAVVGTAFRSLDLTVVEEKEKSVVVIENCESGLFNSLNCTLQGSGVIYDVESRSVNQSVIYDYYILTNAHVAYGGQAYKIHYAGYELSDRGTLMGVYTEGTDLAIIKLTTEFELVVLDDDQFETREAIDIYEGQTVFSIGSPGYFENRQENFNVVKEGIIIGLNVPVKLEKDPNEEDDLGLCEDTCYAFQTDAALGPGSSGGAMFDTAGNLIGIHFAGNEENTISSEIPMSKVFEAIDAILGE